MSTKPPSRRTPEPPNLRSDLADRSDVKALLAELQDGLKEGEDPLFYKLRRAAPDPACVGADAARIYVAPREVPGVARPVVETAKVSVRSGVEARRTLRELGAFRRVRGAWILAAALGLVAGGVIVLVLRSVPEPGRSATERAASASGASAGMSVAAVQSVTVPLPAVSAMPAVSPAPMPLPAESAPAVLMRKPRRRGVEDPYDAAAPSPAPGMPRPALSAAESKPEIPSPTPPQGAPRF
ncbi:MAG: hypothetical protein ABI134_34790 [Byssovorax sp.]